jgi:hypothetical protein
MAADIVYRNAKEFDFQIEQTLLPEELVDPISINVL